MTIDKLLQIGFVFASAYRGQVVIPGRNPGSLTSYLDTVTLRLTTNCLDVTSRVISLSSRSINP